MKFKKSLLVTKDDSNHSNVDLGNMLMMKLCVVRCVCVCMCAWA